MVLINPPSLGTRSEGQCRPEFCPERPVPVLVEAHTDLPVRCDLGAEHGNVVLLRCPQLADPSAPRPSLTQVAHVAREGPPGSSGKMGGQLQCGAGRRARAAPLVIYEGEDLNALKLPRPEPCTCVAFPD